MIRILFIIFCLILSNTAYADNCSIICPKESTRIIEGETLLNKITGINFVSEKIAESLIQKELKEALNSSFNANLSIFSVKRLKTGEFKSLTLKSKRIGYKALYMSNFQAQTICPFNRIVYKKNRIYYPNDLPFKFESFITNEDINSTLNSFEFKKELERSTIKFNGIKGFEIQVPAVKIVNDRLYFEIPIKTFFGGIKIKLNADVAIENNKLVLKDITFNSKSNIMNNNMVGYLINKINPVSYEINSINTKYCKIDLVGAKISNNRINTNGIFIINKNYDGEK